MKANTPNVALKVAIIESGKKQRDIAVSTSIPETRLSHIVRGRVEATQTERDAIVRELARPERELFPAAEVAQAS